MSYAILDLLTAILNLTQDIFMKNFADISLKNWLSWKHVKKREKNSTSKQKNCS